MVSDNVKDWMDWVNQHSDARGECDKCHKDDVRLWYLPEEIDPVHTWMYCKDCFLKVLKRKEWADSIKKMME